MTTEEINQETPKTPLPEGMLERKVFSPFPVYGIGAVWIAYAILFPLFRWTDFLIGAAVSAVAYLILSRVFPPKKELYQEEALPAGTGNDGLDRLVEEGAQTLAALEKTALQIENEAVRGKAQEISGTAGKILDALKESPELLGEIRRFLGYYLPTVKKLLVSYERMEERGARGENIVKTMREVENALDTVVAAFHQQLDHLFEAEAFDISTDLDVLGEMLAREGFTDEALELPDVPETLGETGAREGERDETAL